jgi:squalene-hopene/tetraprenyl-beta-curcumene cyclase
MGYRCLREMQNNDGSWGMFVKHNRHLKLDTYSRSIDQPCPGLTARIVIALHQQNGQKSPEIERALNYLRSIQRPDGSIFTLWFHDYVYGTALTLEAFATCGLLTDTCAQQCREWLLHNQNDDGSWGGSYGTPGTVEETSWALAALCLPNIDAPQACLQRALQWLLAQQRPDGTWPQAVIGLYFPAMWYSDDHIANSFALRALGRYQQYRPSEENVEQLSIKG